MIGVVLCGGQSKRMGTDKGLLFAENKRWVLHAFEKLQGLCEQTCISVNASQKLLYHKAMPGIMLAEDNASVNAHGPLLGLLSVHVAYTGQDLLVLACDMVAMNSMVLQNLLQTYNTKPGFDAYVYSNDDGYQPLAGIYTAGLLSKILTQVTEGSLTKFSMKNVLENNRACFIPVSEEWNEYFVNYNFKADIDFQ